ncbi:MAG: ABC-2 family transporter protein [candidate division WOR-3 bacterium]
MKRFSKYLQVVINTVAESSEFRFNHLLSFLVIALPLVFMFLLWKRIFYVTGQIGEFSFRDMVTYYFLVVLLYDITYPGPFWEVIDHIRDGMLNIFLTKPISYPAYIFSLKLGINLPYFLMALIVLVSLGIITGFGKYLITPSNFFSFGVFLIAFTFAIVLGLSLSLLFSLLTFWLEEGRGLDFFLEFLIGLSSGSLLPISLYPRFLRPLCSLLPFRYVLNFPVEVYLGVIHGKELAQGMIIQVFWCVLSYVMLRLLWKKGLKIYEGVGA